jgi:hypothetical protein
MAGADTHKFADVALYRYKELAGKIDDSKKLVK